MLEMMNEFILDTTRRARALTPIKIEGMQKAPFEIGYLTCILQNKYRKMIDIYNSSWTYRKQMLMMDLVLMLGELQAFYFEVSHIIGMLHEIERKFNVVGSMYERYRSTDTTTTTTPDIDTLPPVVGLITTAATTKKPTKFTASFYEEFIMMHTTTTKQRRPAWNRGYEYGWEVNYDFKSYDQVKGVRKVIWPSFGSNSSNSTTNSSSTQGPVIKSPHFGINAPYDDKRILNDISLKVHLAFIKKYKKALTTPAKSGMESGRRVGIESLVMGGRRQDTMSDIENDDQNMKMKLFRLMYESVRDSDLKVKRAELIKQSYANSTKFEIGYLLGDITDKYNIMTDIATTLKRLYHEWKPIEHINAYEQIANLGIDVGHIVDMAKGVEKKLGSTSGGGGGGGGGAGGDKVRKDEVLTTTSTTTPTYFQIN